MVPSGRIDFQLYQKLINNEFSQRRPTNPQSVQTSVTLNTEKPFTVHMQLSNADPNTDSTYKVNEKLTFLVQPTQAAYVYCYYHSGNGEIARIFPNEYQTT